MPASRDRRQAAEKLVRLFEAYGYEYVVPSTIEHTHALGESFTSDELLKFIDPEDGRVACIRPDLTPQVARIVATRLAHHPPPWRICYEGSVLRRRPERARRHREVRQAGVECIGLHDQEGVWELLDLALASVSTFGLSSCHLEFGHAALLSILLKPVPEPHRLAIAQAVSRKDRTLTEERLSQAELDPDTRSDLLLTTELYGKPAETIARAREGLRHNFEGELLELERLSASSRSVAEVFLDLAQTRRFGYYTGVNFALFADGPGQPLLQGGRYDSLLGQFGASHPASGFAVDLDSLLWAAEANAERGPTRERVVLGGVRARVEELQRDLHRMSVSAAWIPARSHAETLSYAKAWKYSIAVFLDDTTVTAQSLKDGRPAKTQPKHQELAQWILTTASKEF